MGEIQCSDEPVADPLYRT